MRDLIVFLVGAVAVLIVLYSIGRADRKNPPFNYPPPHDDPLPPSGGPEAATSPNSRVPTRENVTVKKGH